MTVAEAEARLTALGAAWERSKLPPGVYEAGYRRCRVTPSTLGFLVEFLDQARHVPICAAVRLTPAAAGPQPVTTLRATCRVRPAFGPLSWLAQAVLLGLAVGGLASVLLWELRGLAAVIATLFTCALAVGVALLGAEYWQRELTPLYVASLRAWFGAPDPAAGPAVLAPSGTRSN